MDLIDDILKQKTIKFLGRGNSKFVYLVEYNGKKYAISTTKNASSTNIEHFLKRKAVVDKFIEQGVNTPALIASKFDEQTKTFVEVQEFAEGERLFERHLNRYCENLGLNYNELEPTKKEEITVKFIADFKQKQKKLLNLNKNLLLKFIKDISNIIIVTGAIDLDCHADNYLLDSKTGISFVDIDTTKIEDKKMDSCLVIQKAIQCFVWILEFGFSPFKNYKMIEKTDKKFLELQNKNLQILERLFNAIIENAKYFNLTEEQILTVLKNVQQTTSINIKNLTGIETVLQDDALNV